MDIDATHRYNAVWETEEQNGPTVVVDVPKRFYEDHRERECGYSGRVVKEMARSYRLLLDRRSYDDLLSDADYYGDDGMLYEMGSEAIGIIGSAKATRKALLAVGAPR